MRIFVTGGTGFVGSHLTRFLVGRGHEITILSRSGSRGPMEAGIQFVKGDPMSPGPWQEEVAKHDAVINLAGASIFTPWTTRARQMILDSRILTTRHIVEALAGIQGVKALISTSAVGFYGGHLDDEVLDEHSPPGTDFLAEVGIQWEMEALRAKDSGARVAICRFGVVFGKGGGALDKMVSPFKWFMGSTLGSGKQWFSWIHQADLDAAIAFVLENPSMSGPVNCVSPNPVRNRELTETLAKVLHRPLIMPAVPGFALRMAMGEFAQEALLKGQRAVPRILQEAGFHFRYPTLRQALENLLD